jgi:hypothetical protein
MKEKFMHNWEVLDVYIGKPFGIEIELSIGFLVFYKGKIKIHVFLLNNKGFSGAKYFIDNAPTICQKIVEQTDLKKSIQDIEWTYTVSLASSKLKFEALGGVAVLMRFENGAVAKNYCGGQSLEYYEEGLNDPRGLVAFLQDGVSDDFPSTSKPIVEYLVHTPKRTKKIHVMEHPYKSLPIDEHPVVLVDTNVFISYWEDQCQPKRKNLFSWKPKPSGLDNDDLELLKSSFEMSLEYSIPHEMPCGVGLCDKNIRFTNGRHRFVNLAKAGAPFIPVQTSKHGLDTFREFFEWEPTKNFYVTYE